MPPSFAYANLARYGFTLESFLLRSIPLFKAFAKKKNTADGGAFFLCVNTHFDTICVHP